MTCAKNVKRLYMINWIRNIKLSDRVKTLLTALVAIAVSVILIGSIVYTLQTMDSLRQSELGEKGKYKVSTRYPTRTVYCDWWESDPANRYYIMYKQDSTIVAEIQLSERGSITIQRNPHSK